jgi:hypothetical protein
MEKLVPVTITLLIPKFHDGMERSEEMRYYHLFKNLPSSEGIDASVNDYYEFVFDRKPRFDFQDYPLTSVCGQLCVNIIDRGKALLDVTDVFLHDQLIDSINTAIEVVCFG